MKYLVYARRNGEQGEERHSCYSDYEVVEGVNVTDAVFNWWEVVTSKAKEVYDFHRERWEVKESNTSCSYFVKDKEGWMTYEIIVIPLPTYSKSDVQELDKLNVNRGRRMI